MANEGIMALPQGMGMEGEQAQQQQQTVTSADSYDAAMTALGMVNPGEDAALKEAIRQNIGDLQLAPAQLDMLIQVFEYISQNPSEYKSLLQDLIKADALDEGDMPEEYDPEFIGVMLVVLQEMRQMQGAGAQEPMNMSPVVQGLQPMGMASGGLADVASYLAGQGRNGDTMLAHITPQEAQLLRRRGGSGTINPVTGLPEFFLKKIFNAAKSVVKGVVNVVKDVVKSPVGRILATVALATVLGPAGVGLSMSTAAGLAGAGTTLLGGGSVKDALISGAMGYIGGGGTIMGTSPLSAVGGYLPGAAGSALNTGLTTGLIGAGIGKLGGMSTQDALRMGLISGASAAALQGLNSKSDAQMRDSNFTGEGSSTGPVSDAQMRDPNFTGEGSFTGPVEASGPLPTAKDLPMLADKQYSGGLKVPGMNASGQSAGFDSAGNFKADYSMTGGTPAPVPGIDAATGTGTRFGGSASGLNASVPRTIMPSGAANYSLSSVPQGAQPGFIDSMVTGAKDLYKEYLSPSRPGVTADAGILTKYGPLALAGTAAMSLAGGTKTEPAQPGMFDDRDYYAESKRRAEERNKFLQEGGYGLSVYNKPTTPENPVVPTPSYSTIPVEPPGKVIPAGITNSPAGVAQPYNMAGLYGIPIIYGPDGLPRRMAKGGDAKMTNFPRKNGPINGPGTGTSDDIPAMLSDGEFVFTAKAVRNAGGGSRRKGAARMYKMMKMLEGGAVKGK